MVHESIIRGYHVYKEVWKPKIGIGSTARAMHDQHAVNSTRIRLTASIKAGKYVCAYEKVCAYKKGALNNPSLRYFDCTSSIGKGHLVQCARGCSVEAYMCIMLC